MSKEYKNPCKEKCLEHKYHCVKCNTAVSYSPANFASRPFDIPNQCENCERTFKPETPQYIEPSENKGDTISAKDFFTPKHTEWEEELSKICFMVDCSNKEIIRIEKELNNFIKSLLAKEREEAEHKGYERAVEDYHKNIKPKEREALELNKAKDLEVVYNYAEKETKKDIISMVEDMKELEVYSDSDDNGYLQACDEIIFKLKEE